MNPLRGSTPPLAYIRRRNVCEHETMSFEPPPLRLRRASASEDNVDYYTREPKRGGVTFNLDPSIFLFATAIVLLVVFLGTRPTTTTTEVVHYVPSPPTTNASDPTTSCAKTANLPDISSCEEIFSVNLSHERMVRVGVEAFVHKSRVRSHMRWKELPTYSLNTYVVPERDPFYLLSDTYDNALAVIYFSALGDFAKATSLAETLLLVMTAQGYRPNLSTRESRLGLNGTAAFCENENNRCEADFRGVYARFTPDGTVGWNAVGVLTDVTFVKDMGNNGWMALSFCKLAARLQSSHPAHAQRYGQICLDLSFVLYLHRCDTGAYRGIMGRTTRQGDAGSYLSIEHNIDAYAVAKFVVEKLSITADDRAWLTILVARTRDFYRAMRVGDEIQIGTGLCSAANTINTGDPPPVDAVTWGILAGVTQDALLDVENTKNVLDEAVRSMFTVDTPVFGEGCESEELAVSPRGSRIPCDFLHESYLYRGFKFTKNGYGPQWENAGSGAMALKRMGHRNATEALDSLVRLWKKFPTGVPAHFEIEDSEKKATGDYQPNTGLSWSYYRKQHTASVIWTAAAVLQDEGVKGMNLFGTEEPDSPKKTEPVPAFAADKLDAVFTCNTPNVYRVSASHAVEVDQELFGNTSFGTLECTEENYKTIRSSFSNLADCTYIQYYVDRQTNKVVVGDGTDHPQWGLCATILPVITEEGFQRCSSMRIIKQLSLGFEGEYSLNNLKKACDDDPALPPGSPLRGLLNTCLDRATRAVILWKIAEECK